MKAHQSKPQHGQNQLSDETKFKVVSVVFFATEKLCYGFTAFEHRQLAVT